MIEQLLSAIQDIRSNRQIDQYNEIDTRQFIILRILSILGWNTYLKNEVQPEYPVSEGRVDYCLHYGRSSKLFIEVKQTGVNLDSHQKQLVKYSMSGGGKLAILTIGIEWWFYLPLMANVSFDKKRFATVDISKELPEDVVRVLTDYLSKESVVSGKAVEIAESVYQKNTIEHQIQEALPKAWKRIVSEPDEMLVDLIAETTEEMCGHKPDSGIVEVFITEYFQIAKTVLPKKAYVTKSPHKNRTSDNYKPASAKQSYTNTKPSSFIFNNRKYEITKWRQLLMRVCGIMLEVHPNEFETVLTFIRRNGKPYFSRNLDDLHEALKIKVSSIYVEGLFSANSTVRMTMRVLEHFNYSGNDIEIFTNKPLE